MLITTEKLSKISVATEISHYAHALKIMLEVINIQAELQVDNKEILKNYTKL